MAENDASQAETNGEENQESSFASKLGLDEDEETLDDDRGILKAP